MAMPGLSETSVGKRNEWQTPEHWLDRVRKVLKTIDLDPATTRKANESVQAEFIYTKEDDGLTRPWFGNCFCNPPYGAGLIRPFCEKMVAEWTRTPPPSRMSAMISLTNSDTSTKWTRMLFESAFAACFPHKRLSFIDPQTGLHVAGNNRPQAFWYWGIDGKRFRRVFGKYGTVLWLPRGELRR